MVQERNNRLMAYRVEQGLYMQKRESTRAAAAYLAHYGVPIHVSMRVLSTPNKRDMAAAASQGLWFDIVRSAGATYGARTDFS